MLFDIFNSELYVAYFICQFDRALISLTSVLGRRSSWEFSCPVSRTRMTLLWSQTVTNRSTKAFGYMTDRFVLLRSHTRTVPYVKFVPIPTLVPPSLNAQ
jgi:hypothetical protein